MAPLLRRRGGRLGRAPTSSGMVGIELGTNQRPESAGFIANARSAVFRVDDDQDDDNRESNCGRKKIW